MNYLGLGVVGRAGARLYSSCKDLYNDLNGANLTGAVDVVVVKQLDGSFKATPFHVRFGKWGVLRTGDLQKEVEVEVNGEPVHNRMMLDENGSAFFVKPKHSQSMDISETPLDFVYRPHSHSLGSITDTSLETFEDPPKTIVEETRSSSDSAFVEDKGYESLSAPIEVAEQVHDKSDISDKEEEEEDEDGLAVYDVGMVKKLSASNETLVMTQSLNGDDDDDDGPESVALVDKVFSDDVNTSCDNDVHRGVVTALSIPKGTELDSWGGSSNNHNDGLPSSLKLELLHETEDNMVEDKAYSTPTDNPREFLWIPEKTIEEEEEQEEAVNKLCSDLDSGVLSDSAIELHRKRYPPLSGAHSDSELEERMDHGNVVTKTEGERSVMTKTGDVARRQIQQQLSADAPRYSLWGAIRGIWSRKNRRRFSSIEEGIYLSDLDSTTMKDEEKALYLHVPSAHSTSSNSNVEEDVPSDVSSGIDSSSPQPSPLREKSSVDDEMDKIIDMLSDISISQCGFSEDIDEKSFVQSQVSFREFCSRPDLLSSDSTVIRINGKYYSWSVAGPMIMSALIFQRPLLDECQSSLEKKHLYKTKSKQSMWRLWSKDAAEEKFGKTEDSSMASTHQSTGAGDNNRTCMDEPAGANINKGIAHKSLPPRLMAEDPLSSDDEYPESEQRTMNRVKQRSLRRKRFIFTNELTSDELSRWPLKPGKNDLVFSITTKYQGTARARCTLYLWNYDDKIVVSDFDGTITRSDVAGQVLPFLGKDWTHFGVIELFSAIHKNGYNFLYLSARAIGQSMYTKNYLRNTRSKDCYLPDGPLLVTPFSLYKAFKKEVIERKPEEFKILCLQQIRTFFPEDYNPFHAGFGNKPSDAKSYLEVNIPSSRIFSVNPKGELKHELSWTFQSSYIGLMEFIDGQFPPLSHTNQSSDISELGRTRKDSIHSEFSTSSESDDMKTPSLLNCGATDDNYSSFVYWQHSLNSFDSYALPDLL